MYIINIKEHMPDLRLCVVDYEIILRRYESVGILGKGLEIIMDMESDCCVMKDNYKDEYKLM